MDVDVTAPRRSVRPLRTEWLGRIAYDDALALQKRAAEEVSGERVTTNLFAVLGVQPYRGRLFSPEEETRGNAAIMLSYGLWQERYGGDPELVGKPIAVNGERLTVVGIAPAIFTGDYSASFAPRPRLWVSGFGPEAGIPGVS